MTARVRSSANWTMMQVMDRGVLPGKRSRAPGLFPTMSAQAPGDPLLYFFLILGLVLFIYFGVSL